MARIPQHELNRLKKEINLVELVRASGVKLTGSGDTLIGLCPFHEDHDPSLIISRGKNLWSCKGACNRGGSVVDWVMLSRGVGFREAAEDLRERLGLPRPSTPKTTIGPPGRCRPRH